MIQDVLEFLRDEVWRFPVEYLIEIFIIYLLIYTFLRFMEGTRGEGILKGIALLILMVPILVTIVAERFKVLDRLLVIVIIVQPELRRALVRLGQTRIFGIFLKGQTRGMVEEIVKAAFKFSRRKIGALIAIEREVGLQNYVERGTVIDGVVSSDLLATIFFPGSDLHDGAVIVQKERIAAAGCLFPLSENPNLGSVFGTRHRAALGITEETDAIVVVVSEETGVVSFGHRGKLERPLNSEQLRSLLLKYYAQLEDVDTVTSGLDKEPSEV